MTMTTCRECGKPVSDTAIACPHCGHRPPPDRGWIGWMVGVPLGLIVAFFVLGTAINAKTPQFERDARKFHRDCRKAFPDQSWQCLQTYERMMQEGAQSSQP